MSRYIDAEKIQFLPLSVKIGGNKYDVGAEPERMIMEIHDMVAYKGDIDAIPIADVEEVKHGKWSRHEDCFEYEYYRCSVCGDEFYLYDGDPINNHYFYCPNCGAKMDKEKEE